jgi:acetyl-CoA synthetase
MLGTVGEPINPEAWEWYYNVVGDGRCPIVDTWWQTETGGILITPLPGATDAEARLGHAAVLRRQPQLVDDDGTDVLEGQPRATCASPTAGRARCARSTATTSASCRPISPPTRATTSPVTAAAATRTATTGSPAASMT